MYANTRTHTQVPFPVNSCLFGAGVPVDLIKKISLIVIVHHGTD